MNTKHWSTYPLLHDVIQIEIYILKVGIAIIVTIGMMDLKNLLFAIYLVMNKVITGYYLGMLINGILVITFALVVKPSF